MHQLSAGLVATILLVSCNPRYASADEPKVHFFDAQGVRIRYLMQGRGEPVVLIHGLFASAEMNWRLPGIFSTLAKNHQVIALDLPAHGGSDKPEKDEAYGTQFAEDVVLLLDHLKIPKAHIVGYSLGGMTAGKLLATHQDRVLSAALCGMGWVQEGGRFQKTLEQPAMRAGRAPINLCIKNMRKLAISETALKAIHVPVCVIIGDRDSVKQSTVAPLKIARPDWPVVEIEGANHLTCIFKKSFSDEIVRWLDKNKRN